MQAGEATHDSTILIGDVINIDLLRIYPEPQNAPDVSPGMNVPNFPEGKRPKATDVSPWYGVY